MAHAEKHQTAALGRARLLSFVIAMLAFASVPALAQTVSNTATVTPPAGVTCADVASNPTCVRTATDTDTVVAPLLNLTKTHVGNFTVGTNGVYILTPSNSGTAPTSGTITVIDTLPTGLTFVSGIGTGWACAAAAQTVTCTSATVIAAGATGTAIQLTVGVAATALPNVTNTARTSGGGDTTCPAAPAATQTRCTPSDPTLVSPAIDAVNDPTATLTTDGGTVPNVVSNDTTNGQPAVIGTNISAPTLTGNGGLTGLTANPDGTLTVPAGTAPGTYTATYQICTLPATTPATCDTATVQIVVSQAPAVTVVKTAGTPSGNTAGSTVAYSFLVTNTGNVTLSGIAIVDALLDAPAVCAATTLAPAATTTCTGTHTITQAEVNAGTVDNSATATGTPPVGPPVTSPPSTTNTPIASAPALTIAKTAGAPSGNTAGSTIAYSFVVTNTGNVTLTGVAIDDIQLDAPAVCAATTLVPAATTTCTGTHTVTQAEVNAGTVDNSATATGTPPGGGTTTSPPSTTSTPIASAPALTIAKTAGAPSGNTAGSTIAYSFVVTNTGNVTLTGVAINDVQLDAPAVCDVTTLLPGEIANCAGTHTITQAEVNAGTVDNSATATGTTPGGGTTTSPPSTTSTPIASAPALTIAKTAGAPSGNTAGSTIAYSFVVTNTGNVTLTGLTINDAQLDAPAVCDVTTLLPGEVAACTGMHTITQAEVNAGTVDNSATATGTPPGGGTTTSPPSTTSTPIASAPALTIAKTAAAPSGNTAGSTIGYTFVVTNTGNVTLTGVVINDAQLDAPAVCDVTTLLPGEIATCTGTHTITQAEVNAGTVDNSATATGTTPGNTPVTSPPSTTSTPIASTPALTIAKTAAAPSGNTAGGTIAYSFVVTNTGNVTLTGLTINDAQLDAPAVCDVTTLLPGEVAACTGTHTITQDEVNAGVVDNSATATGTPPGGGTTTSPPSTTSTPIASTPAIAVVKTAGTASGNTAGSTIGYSFLVTNTGNVTLTGVAIVDALLDAPATCGATTLLPTATTTCTGTHTITQAEVNAGTVDNSATATGTPPGGGTTTSPPSTTSTPIASAPAIAVVKTAGTPSGNTVGSTIGYSFLVTNTGNVTLTGVAIDDIQLDAPAVCAATTLAPDATTTCTGTHTITQAEVNAGTVDNSATVSGTAPGNTPVTSPPSTTSTPIASTPALTIAKTAGTPSGNTAGSTIAYSFVVTNTGNVTLTGVVINDAQLDAPAVCDVTTLLPGDVATCTGTHTITQAEVNAGTVDNSATATGTPPVGPPVTSPPSTTNTPIASAPAIAVVKTAGTPSGNTAGSTIGYSFLVTNTGNVTLSAIAIVDALLDAPAVCAATTLAPAATTTCTGTHTITQAEVNAGTVDNSATVTGTPPVGPPVTSPPSTTNTPIASAPAVTVVKTAGTPSGNTAGSTVAYSFLVTNTGNVTLSGIAIVDALLDAPAMCAATTLAPAATTTCTGTHTITQAEVNAGTVDNNATATGTPPGGGTTTSPPSTTSTPIVQTASLTLDKSATVADTNANAVVGDIGDTITYSFSMTNTGNVTLAPVTVADPLLPSLVCTVATLAPAATASCAASGNTYVITAADAVAGSRANTATATGDAPGAVADPTASDTETVATAVLAIDAVDDDYSATPVNGTTGGDTPSVLANDTLNGEAVTVGNVTLTPGTSPVAGLTMNPDGTITIAPGTAAGTYVYPYTICEVLNPSNCDTANATVVVDAAPIVAIDDSTATPVNGSSGGIAIPDIFANDTLNGLPVVREDITVTNTTVPPQLVFDPGTGEVSVVPGSPAGTYTFNYTICELLNPTNCATALVTVVVEAALIVANDDTFPPVNGADGGTTATVIGNDSLNGQPITLGTGGDATLVPGTSPNPGLLMNPDGTITIAPGTPAGTYQYPYTICEVLNPSNCDSAIATVIVDAAVIDAVDDTFPSINGENGGTTAPVLVNDTLNSVPVTSTAVTLAPGTSPNPGLTMNPDGTITIAPGTPAGTYEYPYTICEVLNPANCDTATATVVVVSDFALRILKTAGVREVKIGDLVRYTITIENVGTSNLVGGSIVDTPAAGFSYVEGSLTVVDGDNMGTAAGQSPIRFDGIDVAAGETATLVYAMRVGAGVRPGVQVNQALATTQSGQPVSNVSTAQVMLTTDALIDDSLLLGTVFDDRDGDGWQDSAALGGVRVQGGFAAGAYVPGSTTVDRGAGPQPVADASSPMLHGIEVGAISARQSAADPVANHQVVIRQRLSEAAFTADFVLTSAQGVTVRMDAAGNTTVEKSGEAARGLNAAEPKVERRIAQGEDGYVVDYVISNAGIDERGIPGVRIASVEGLLIETDQFGRYHLAGISGGNLARGRNFILKVDPSTLPPGTVFTTDNPLVRRITPGVPVRFDFGVKLPAEEIKGGEQIVELELGEVVFAPGSAELRDEYLPVIEQIAAKVIEFRGGEVLISGTGDSEALAFERAASVKAALQEKVPADIAPALTVSVRAAVDDPSSLVVGIAEGGPLLGTVLFDTDRSTVKPQYLPILDQVAAYLDAKGGSAIAIVGHADPRGSDAYNIALGMRRARAVYDVVAARLSPAVRAKVRVESSNDPAAPAGNSK